jgi:hypothetical protein
MNEISERQAIARAAAVALGLAVLYGAITGLVVWLSGGETPFLCGGIAAGGTAVLTGLGLAAVWGLFREDENPRFEPDGPFKIVRILFGVLVFAILIFPLVVLTFGRLGRWLEGNKEA